MIINKRRYEIAAYFAGALLARLSDEMDGQILLLISLCGYLWEIAVWVRAQPADAVPPVA